MEHQSENDVISCISYIYTLCNLLLVMIYAVMIITASLFLTLSIFLSIYVSIYVSIYLSLTVISRFHFLCFFSVSLSLSISIFLLIFLSLSLPLSLSLSLSVCLSLSLSFYEFVSSHDLGNALPADIEHFIASGATQVLLKPVSLQVLGEALSVVSQ